MNKEQEKEFENLFVNKECSEVFLQIGKQQQKDIQAVLSMLEGDTDRKEIVNYIKEYLICFKKKLECEICEDIWREDTDHDCILEDEESIREHGRCCGCFEEYGETRWADQ